MGTKKKTRRTAGTVLGNNDAGDSISLQWLIHRGLGPAFVAVSLFGLLIRAAVSLHSYSGAGNPPKYGDFEAQRHWMEITLNLPPRDWYTNGTSNDLSYWGLDYPPLTAYQSYFHGLILRFFDPDSVALFTSRGYETYFGKLLMRWTVLGSDALLFFPAVLYFLYVYHYGCNSRSSCEVAWHMVMLLINPCLILIDHGHFQYNCISLGFTVGAVAAILSNRDLLGSSLFCLALNHKQMSAYYAPAFFGHLLGKCIRRRNPLLEISKLGLVVIGTFAIIWWPYLYSTDAIFGVVSRLAPFERGIYEDYVANFWCATSIIIKWKRLFMTQSLKLLSLVATVSTFLPSMIQQIRSPSGKGFIYSMLNTSLSFYLFSFQVHEKSILLPMLPASLMAREEPFLYKWLILFGLLSMFPLLHRDGLTPPYMALFALFFLLFHTNQGSKDLGLGIGHSSAAFQYSTTVALLCSFVLHFVYLTAIPPEKYPYLFEAMMMILCFIQFSLLAIYCNWRQWKLSEDLTRSWKEKKLL
ncbi:hypothetical protein SAY87_007058 [Trapa incisa]|uniref:Alpha-1,3-glucosyltransferase n=1 Tax=Trapa incisa TaxID=236973 RepID=A0AAN7PZW1_9MYRT|nr:hypothetical protein SAY87_007058 [Trapa incisa]